MPPDRRARILFEPDAFLPGQHADRVRRRAALDPQRQLLAAVLELAIDDYAKHVASCDPRGRAIFGAAEAWIALRDARWPFAFESLCLALDLDAGYVRRGLRASKKHLARDGMRGVPHADDGLAGEA